jgi:hypothetical protein
MKRVFRATGQLLLFAFIFLHNATSLAQSATITGVVFDKEQTQTTFTVPKGKITVYLPDDMRVGDMISGTVTATPSGKDEKEQKKNLAELLKYKIYLPDGTPYNKPIPLPQNGPGTFSITPATSAGKPMAISLHDPDNKLISTAQLPTLPVLPIGTGQTVSAILAKKIVTNTEPLVLILSGTSVAPKLILSNYYSTQSTGKTPENYELEAIVHSPRKAVYTFPPSLSGMYMVCVQFPKAKNQTIDLVNIVDIRASIGKGNLMKGENTQMTIEVVGLEGCPYRPVKLAISNNTPNIIHLEQGDQQLLPVDQSDNPVAFVANQPFQTTQNVIGQMIGGFEIHTTLQVPPTAYANTIQPYLVAAEKPQEFNSAINALKNDINHYVSDQNVNKTLAAYLQEVRNQLPQATNSAGLAQAKAMAGNLFNPLSSMPGGQTFFRQLSELDALQPEIADQSKMTQFVHPLHDLAGKFDTKTNILTVNPTDQDGLLQYLGAIKMENGNYTFTLSDGVTTVKYTDVVTRPNEEDPNEAGGVCEGGSAPFPVPVPAKDVMPGAPVKQEDPRPAPNPKDNQGVKAESVDGPKPTAGAGIKPTGTTTKDEPKKDVPSSPTPKDTTKKDTTKSKSSIEWPEKGTTFTDSSGRKYEFYKNAECKHFYTTPSSGCGQNLKYEKNEKTGKIEGIPTGKYDKWIWQDVKRCIKGKGFCTEMEQIGSTQMIYEDPECQRLIEIKTYNHSTCP